MITTLALITIFILLCACFFFITNGLVAPLLDEEVIFRHTIYAALCFLAVVIILVLLSMYRVRKLSELDAGRPCLSVPCYEESCIHNNIR